MQLIFAAAQVTLTAAVLLYASYRDYKAREVSNRVWAIYAPIALALSLANFLLYEPSELSYFGLSVGLTVGFAFLLFYTGGFGGADSKALMCIALSLPFFPQALTKPLIPQGLSPLSQLVFPIIILTNSVLIAAASGVFLLLRNLARRAVSKKPLFQGTLAQESIGKKIMVLITAQKFSISTLKAKWHVYPLEDVAEESEGVLKRKLLVVPKDEGRDQIVERLAKASAEGKIEGTVWATPGLPMLIFVTVGLFLALSVGDIVWILVGHMFG